MPVGYGLAVCAHALPYVPRGQVLKMPGKLQAIQWALSIGASASHNVHGCSAQLKAAEGEAACYVFTQNAACGSCSCRPLVLG